MTSTRFPIAALRLAGVAIFGCLCCPAILAAKDGPLTLNPRLAEAEQQRIDAIARAVPSTVCVFVPGGGGGGSGVLISPDGFALTNFHVTSPAGSFMRCGLSDGNIYDAVIVGIDPVGDLALIKLLGRDDFPYATMADSRLASAGDWVMVIGNPFLLASNLQPTVTWGILSGVGRYQYPSGTLLEYADCLQTDASVNPGNSGGPIYNAEGELLGIVGRCSFEKRGRVNVGVGYAISINQAKNFIGYLHSGRIVDHATLGATVASDSDGGVRVSNILESSDAYRRGLTYSAEILEVDGRVVHTANELQNVLATLPAGWRVKLVYRNQGETVHTLVRLRSVHRQDELLTKMAGAMPPPPPLKKPPKEEEGGSDEPDGEKKATPRLAPNGDASNPIPPAVASLYEAKRGFANYAFNEIQQERFITRLRKQFPAKEDSDTIAWNIRGKTDDGRDVAISVTTDKLAIVVGDVAVEPKTKADLYDNVDAQNFAGILPALAAWQRMLIDGPKKFGETIYLGTMPLAGERPLRDCMVANDGELEVRFLSHPESELVEAIEVFADRDEDPAELWITRPVDDPNAIPITLDLRYGIESVLRIHVDSWENNGEANNEKESVDE
ncbi:S1C family serine protease [Novipirellula aureliae]|nr:trypsin-like peptidase domain-containing protein [Novipirellula aureliae]